MVRGGVSWEEGACHRLERVSGAKLVWSQRDLRKEGEKISEGKKRQFCREGERQFCREVSDVLGGTKRAFRKEGSNFSGELERAF